MTPESSSASMSHSMKTAFLILFVPVVLGAMFVSGACMMRLVIQYEFLDGEFVAIALIGVLGGIGGAVAAARDGSLTPPHVDSGSQQINLGAISEIIFGAVGAFVLFLLAPGLSDQVQMLGSNFQREVMPTASPPPNTGNGVTAQPTNDPKLDWVELIAMSLVGGYAGRGVITRAMELYVTKEDIRQAARAVEDRRQRDLESLRLAHDQLDINTPAPSRDALQAAILNAQPGMRELIYVDARRTYHELLGEGRMSRAADGGRSVDSPNPAAKEVALRIVPIMEALRQSDRAEEFRGCRFILADAMHRLGKNDLARQFLLEAMQISSRTHKVNPPEYQQLRDAIEA